MPACRRPIYAGVMAVAALLSACGRGSAPGGEPSAFPKVVRYAISVSHENPEEEASRLEPIGHYLESQLHIPVEIVASSGYGAVIEALRAKKIEACSIGSFAYLIAAEKAGAEAIAMRGMRDGSPGVYSGGLAVAAGSPIHSMEDVVKRAKDLTVSFVDPASASGNLVQRAYLDSLGINPERDFKKVVFSQNHLTSATTLVAGKTDLAAVGETIVPALVRSGQLREGGIRFIWISPRIPESPVAVRSDLPRDFKLRLQTALLEMHSRAPEAYLNMTAKVYMERYRGTRIVPATDEMFDPLRKLARGMKLSQLLE